MAARLRPDQVFTPGRLPLDVHHVYAQRRGPEEELHRLLARGQFPLVTGEYGVGKTSLVQRYLQDEAEGGPDLYVAVSGDLRLDDVHRHALERLNYSVTVSSGASRATEGGLAFRGLTAKRAVSKSEEKQVVVTSPTDIGMLDILAENQLTVVLDEMHKSSPHLRSHLVDFLKAVKTSARDFPRVVIVGTTLDAERLVQQDPGIDRYVKEVTVRALADSEARYIVREGMNRLNLSIGEDVIVKVVETAVGAPTIVHQLALDMAELAIDDGRRTITDEDFQASVHMYLEDHGKWLYSGYVKAIETTGPKRWRRRILHAMATIEGDYATMEQIRERIQDQTGDAVASINVGEPLQKLKHADFGSVLQDVERYEGGSRVYNLTAFSDPMMKSFIRFMASADGHGVKLPDLKEA